jgi:transcriptional regulator GlxA family with amidase domain
VNNPSKQYSLETLSKREGLSQSKLQVGFKLLYARTITEYNRHTRLDAARNYIRNSDMNISQVTYTIGFSSRVISLNFLKEYVISSSKFLNKTQKNLN